MPAIIISAVVVGLGIFLLVDRFIFRRRQQQKIISWYSTTATRTENAEITEFSYSVDGKKYIWSPSYYYNVDETVGELEIFYNPENHEESAAVDMISNEHFAWAAGMIAVGSAIFFFGYWVPRSGMIVNEEVVGLLFGGVFAFAGICLAIFATRLTIIPHIRKRTFEESTAICVKHLSTVSTSNSGSSTVYLPVFEYESNGITYQMAGFSANNKVYSNFGVVPVGEKRKIRINPENPRDAIVEMSASRINVQSIFVWFMASTFILSGAFVMFVLWLEIDDFSLTVLPPQIESRAPVPFEIFGNFDASRFDDLMAQFEREFAPYGGVILMEIYEESLLAMLNDPDVSPLQRARENNFLVEHFNPVELFLLRNEENSEFYYSNTNTQNGFEWYGLEMGHGGGIFFHDVFVEAATPDFLARVMRNNARNDTILEAHYVLFDDPHLRYEPALFVWFRTPEDTRILWVSLEDAEKHGLFYHSYFAENWEKYVVLR